MKAKLILLITLFYSVNLFALNIPTHSSPANGSVSIHTDATLWINQVTGATDYDYLLDTVASFDSPALRTKTHTSAYSGWTPNDLYFNKTYYWKIRARNATDTSLWSSVWSFTTITFGVTPNSPASGSTARNLSLTLWINDLGAESFDYQLDTVASFNSPDLQEYTHTDIYGGKTVSDLRYGQTYYWRVRGRNNTDTSQWSSAWNFTTKGYGVTLQSPYNNTTGIDPKITLFINKVTGSENYDYQLDTVPSFDSPDLQVLSHTDAFSGWTVSDLRYGQKYYWRARGRNNTDTSGWTGAWNFTTKGYGVTLQSPYNNTTSIPPLIALFINKVTGSDNYDYQLDTLSTFDSPDLQEFSHTNSFSGWSVSDLRYNQKYYWRARGRNDTDTSGWTGTWNFTTKVYGATPASPASGSISISTNTTLWLNKVTGSDNYDYQIDTTLNFNSPLLAEYTHSNTYSGIGISLTRYGQKYYWRVRGRNDTDTSRWSSAWNLETFFELTESPVLISPSNGSIDITYASVSLDWNSITNVNSYQYEVSTSNDFSSIEKSGTTSLTDYTISNLQPNTVYYWRVRGENANGYSPWSGVWSFTTEQVVLSTPVLTSPSNNTTNISAASVDFYWESVFGANGYTFEISQDNNFASGVTTQNVSNTTTNLVGLNSNTTYYWRVSATDGTSTSQWSPVWSFSTENNASSIQHTDIQNIKIYPNPADDVLFMKSETPIDFIRITDLNGKEVYIKKTEGRECIIETGQFKNGIYLIELNSKNGRIIKKLFIAH